MYTYDHICQAYNEIEAEEILLQIAREEEIEENENQQQEEETQRTGNPEEF